MKRSSKLKAFTTIFLFALLLSSISFAEIINPKTYYSADKQYSLKVMPTNQLGIGQSNIKFSRNGILLWKKNIDSTFSDVKISKNGQIFAYSYSKGLEYKYRYKNKNTSNLTLWALSKHGEIIAQDDFERGLTMTHMHANNDPQALGILLQENADTAVFRFNASMHTEDNEDEKWIQYSIKTGERKADLLIDLSIDQDKTYGDIHEVIALSNQDYYLISITKLKYDRTDKYILFYLMDTNGQIIWSHESNNELDTDNQQVKKYIENNTLINYHHASKIFSITDLDIEEIISYSITNDNVIEVSTKDLDLYESTSNATTVHKNLIEPPLFISSFNLSNTTKNSKMPQRISIFGLDDDNNIATLYKSKNTQLFTVIKPNNSIQTSFAINIKGLNDYKVTSIKYKGDNKWLVLANRYDKPQPILVEVNSKDQTSKQIKIDAKGAKKFIIHQDKSFTILAEGDNSYLRHFSEEGKPLWTFQHDSYGEPDYISSPESITLTKNNQIIVLDNIRNKLNIYNINGEFISTIVFKNTGSGDLNFTTQLISIDDIIYVVDSGFIHKFSFTGEWLGKITPTQLNGKKFSKLADMQVTKNNHIYLSDYNNVFEFDENIKHINRFGQLPNQQLLNKIAWLNTNSQGDIYLFNQESYSVIVFAANGKQKKVFSLKPSKIPTDSVSGQKVFIDSQDTTYMNLGLSNYALFDKEGQFLRESKFDKSCSKYCFNSYLAHIDANVFWQDTREGLKLADFTNGSIKSIPKDANGDWLVSPNHLDIDAKGRLIVATGKFLDYGNTEKNITIIDKTGEPLSTFRLDDNSSYLSNLTFAGDYIYLRYSKENSIRIFNFQGQQVSSLNLNASISQCSDTLLHADSKTNKIYFYLNNEIFIYKLLKN